MWIILAITVITINVVKPYNSSNKILSTNNKRKTKAGAELGQAQVKLGFDFTLVF